MTNEPKTRAHYWERGRASKDATEKPKEQSIERLFPGETLAALRQGIGREAGSIPAMWRYYSVASDYPSRPSQELACEHICLTLFGLHQQSQRSRRMDQPGQSIATALRSLRHGRYSGNPEALDRRVEAAATSSSITEFAYHLRGLIALLKRDDLGIDYTFLYEDLKIFHFSDGAARVRRRWGRDYLRWGNGENRESNESSKNGAKK